MERTSSLRRRAPPPAAVAESSSKPKSKRVKKSAQTSKPHFPGMHVSSAVGARPYMEDAYGHHVNKKAVVFGVFDGHGGDHCSNYCSTRMCEEVGEHLSLAKEPHHALTDVFTKLDKEYCASEGDKGAGSTATVAVLRPTDNASEYKLNVGFVGDSSAVLIRPDDSYELLTSNHHGSRDDERTRIEKLGGTVLYDKQDDVFRVGGVLAVTRAMGDAYLKPYVSGTPEVKEVSVADKDVVVVGSDGLWDVFSPEQIIKAIRQHGLAAGIKKLVDTAGKTGDDNVCAIAVDVKTAAETHFATTDAKASASAATDAE